MAWSAKDFEEKTKWTADDFKSKSTFTPTVSSPPKIFNRDLKTPTPTPAPTPQPVQSNFIDNYLKPFQPQSNADYKQMGYYIGGLPVVEGNKVIKDNSPFEILKDNGSTYTVKLSDGKVTEVNKPFVTFKPTDSPELYEQAAQLTDQNFMQRREQEYAAKNPIDRFFTKATDIGFRQDDKTPSLGNPVADVAAGIAGGIMGLATPTGGGQSLGGAMNTAGDLVEYGLNKWGGKLINKLPNVVQKIAPRMVKEVGEGLVYSASKAPDYTAKDWAQNALEDATLGTGLGLLMDGAKNIPDIVKKAQDNSKSKAIDKAYDALKTNMFSTDGVKTQRPTTTEFNTALRNISPIKEPISKDPVKPISDPVKPIKDPVKIKPFEVNKQTLPMEERTLSNIGSKKVNAYQYDNPQVQNEIQAYAVYIKDNELLSGPNKIESTSPVMKKLKEVTKASYAEIDKALDSIIKNQGAENYATAKRVEMVIDDMLTNGFENIKGEKWGADKVYLAKKSLIEGKPIKSVNPDSKYLNGEELPLKDNTIANPKPLKNPKLEKLDSDYKQQLEYIKNNKVMNSELKANELPTNNIEEPKKISVSDQALYAFDKNLRPKIKSTVNEGIKFTTPDTSKKIVNTKDIKTKTNLNTFEKMYSKIVDNQYAIDKFSKNVDSEKVKILASNSRSVPGTVSYILKDGLVDKAGNQIGGSYKDIIDRIPKSQEQAFTDYLLNRHNISRMNEGKPIFGDDITPDISSKRISEYEAKYPDFKQTAKLYDEFMNTFMEIWGVKSGLIEPDTWKVLKEKYPNYVPTYRVMDEVLGPKSLNTKRAFVNQPSLVKKATGSSKPIINPLEKTMELIDKTVKASKYNEVGQSIVEEIRKNPDKLKIWGEIIEEPSTMKMVKDIDIEETMDEFTKQYDALFKKEKLNAPNVVRVMENGKPVYLKVNDKDFFEAITGLTRSKPGDAEKIARYITTPFKSLITTKNPVFAVRNLARDIPTAYINGSEKNPVKFMMGLLDSAKDLKANSEMFREYKALGGGESDFLKSDINKLYKQDGPVSSFNNFIESIPRYAEYKRSVLKGGNTFEAKMKALYNANEVTTNFARQGNITKAVDAFVPYLNASVQGLDKMVRQLKDNPLATVGKGVTIVTIPAVGLYMVNKDNPYYNELDNRTKDNYFIIPNLQDKDSSGNAKTFIKIPKSREYGVMLGALFERTLRGIQGDKKAFKGFGKQVALNIGPNDPLENNIFSPIVTNLPSNKDFANRPIVPLALTNRSPKYQYDDQSTEIAKFLGDKFNFSPKQIDYLVDAYTGIVGDLIITSTRKSTYSGDDTKEKLLRPILGQFKSDPLYSNDIVNTFYENKDKIDTAKQDDKVTGKESRIADPVFSREFNVYYKEISDLYKEIKTTTDQNKVKMLRRQILETAKKANSFFESKTN